MKKVIIILIMLAMCCTLGACRSDEERNTGIPDVPLFSADFNFETDNQYYLGSTKIAEGPEAYYFFVGYYLYYADKDTLDAYPLCNRADCLHDQETNYDRRQECNAYIMLPESISYYNGKLYVINTEVAEIEFVTSIKKFSLDGVYEGEVGTLETLNSVIQHKGKLYYGYTEIPVDAGKDDWGTAYLASYDLGTGKKEIIGQWSRNEYREVQFRYAFGDRVYYTLYDNSRRLEIFNINDGTITTLESINKEQGAMIAKTMIYHDRILYHEYRVNDDGEDIEYNKGLYMAELDGSNPHRVGEVEYKNGLLNVCGEVMIVSNNYYYGGAGRDYNFSEKFIAYKDFKPIANFDFMDVDGDGTSYDYSAHPMLSICDAGNNIIFQWVSNKSDNPAVIGTAWFAVSKAELEGGKATPRLIAEPPDISYYSAG